MKSPQNEKPMNQTQINFLKAFEMVKNPDTWCQGGIAKNENGEYTAWDSSEAIRLCSVGWIHKTFPPDSSVNNTKNVIFNEFLKFILHTTVYPSIAKMNDSCSHEEVVQKWQDFSNQHDWSQYDE